MLLLQVFVCLFWGGKCFSLALFSVSFNFTVLFEMFSTTDRSNVFSLCLLIVVQFVTHSNNSQPVIKLPFCSLCITKHS